MQKDTYIPPLNVHSSAIYNSQKLEATQASITKWMEKEDGILLICKKEWNNAICHNMDRPRDYHTKWSKSDRERQVLYGNSYVCNLKNNTNELIYKTETDSWKLSIWLPKGRG